MVADDGNKNFWNTRKKILLLVSVIVIILGGAYAIGILLQPPSFEDNLIKAKESGASSTTLIDSIEAQDTAIKRNLNSTAKLGISLAIYNFKQNNTNVTEMENKINTINSNYQKELGYMDNVTAFRIAYVNSQISAEDLKKSTKQIFQQMNNLKTY